MKITGILTDQTRYVNGKPLKGYVLFNNVGEAAFIHAQNTARVSAALLNTLRSKPTPPTPQAFMRALLNAEDFTSPVYDAIFRVYYGDEFEVSIAPALQRTA